MVKIELVTEGGIAHRHGIKVGDYLISINGEEIKDVLIGNYLFQQWLNVQIVTNIKCLTGFVKLVAITTAKR